MSKTHLGTLGIGIAIGSAISNSVITFVVGTLIAFLPLILMLIFHAHQFWYQWMWKDIDEWSKTIPNLTEQPVFQGKE